MRGRAERDLEPVAGSVVVAGEEVDEIVAMRVGRGLTTVVDTLGLDAGRRAAWRDLARAAGVPGVAGAFDTAAAECRERNRARAKRIPADVPAGQLGAWAAVREALDAPAPVGSGFRSRRPPAPGGHPDFVLARAGAESGVTAEEAELIGSTRLGGLPAAEAASGLEAGRSKKPWLVTPAP